MSEDRICLNDILSSEILGKLSYGGSFILIVFWSMLTANGWVFLLAGLIITGCCKYNKKNN